MGCFEDGRVMSTSRSPLTMGCCVALGGTGLEGLVDRGSVYLHVRACVKTGRVSKGGQWQANKKQTSTDLRDGLYLFER